MGWPEARMQSKDGVELLDQILSQRYDFLVRG
jgi:hypothetical protein